MLQDEHTQTLLDEIEERVSQCQQAAIEYKQALRVTEDARALFMDATHRSRCADVPWRQIAFAECRARALPPSSASAIERRRRKELYEYRKARGLVPCPRAAA